MFKPFMLNFTDLLNFDLASIYYSFLVLERSNSLKCEINASAVTFAITTKSLHVTSRASRASRPLTVEISCRCNDGAHARRV